MTYLPDQDDHRIIFREISHPRPWQKWIYNVLAAAIVLGMAVASNYVHAASAYENCSTYAIRATWGAEARLRGSPLVFQFRSIELVKQYFTGELPIPNDGIYIAEGLSTGDRRNYEEVSSTGWLIAKDWRHIFNSRQVVPMHEWMVGYFLQHCPYRHNTSDL